MKILPVTIVEPTLAHVHAGRVNWLRRPIAALAELQAGDLLWLREPFHFRREHDQRAPLDALAHGGVPHFACGLARGAVEMLGLGQRRAAYTLPRAAHRAHLEISAVETERLQAITEEQMLAEGYAGRNAWVDAWDRSMKQFGRAHRWSDNPEILLIRFTLQPRPAPAEETPE